MAAAMSILGGGRSALRRTGKLLILRLTPRLLRRWARGGTRSSRISARTALCSAGLSRGGNGAEDRQFAANDADRVQERQPVGIFVGLQGRLMHEAANSEMQHQHAKEFLPNQFLRLASQDDLGAANPGFQFGQGVSARAVSISHLSW